MENNENFLVESITPCRTFVKTYHDFLDSTIVDGKEKIVFILLKRYLNFKEDKDGISGSVYPNLTTLSTQLGMTKKTVIEIIKKLEKKGLVIVKQQGLNLPNIYTLRDFKEIWNAKTDDELETAIKNSNSLNLSEIPTEVLLEELEKRNKKVPETTEPTKVPVEPSTKTNIEKDYKTNNNDCQEKCEKQEQYPLEILKELYEYETMVFDNKEIQTDIDTAFSVLYETLNTTKETIRIKSEDKPTQVVISKLLKLTRFGILYAIEKYKEQTNRIGYPMSYLLTLLYEAETQQHLDITNRVQYDMTHKKQPQEVKEQQQYYEENESVNQKEQAIEEYNHYSEEEKNEIRNKYIGIMFKKEESSDLEKSRGDTNNVLCKIL